jgi:Kef-type K+ transport system membrane component KefB
MRRALARTASTRPARLLVGLFQGLLALLVLAPAALANNDGRGFYGATSDKVVTEAGFILVVFFPTFALVASLIQRHLEKRKDARKAAARSRLGDARWRGGW